MKVKDLKKYDIVTMNNNLETICFGNGTFKHANGVIYMSSNTELKYAEIKKVKRFVKKDPVMELRSDSIRFYSNTDNMYELLTIYEKKDVLDEVETKYLKTLINPFRDKVAYIKKESHNCGKNGIKEYICIYYLKESCTNLPYFKQGTMYKGMEVDEAYSLEDLGI